MNNTPLDQEKIQDSDFRNNYSFLGCFSVILIVLALLYFTFDYWNPFPYIP